MANERGVSPIVKVYARGESNFKERILMKLGKYVRTQTEKRNGLTFMRAKQRVIYKEKDSATTYSASSADAS